MTNLNAKIFWDNYTENWSSLANNPESFYAKRNFWVADLFSRYFENGAALDIGCGPGLLTLELLRRGYDVYGMDISLNMIKKAIQISSEVISDPNKHFLVSTDGSIPFENTFDIVLAIGVFPYVKNYGKYIRLISKHLNLNGYVIASCLNRISFYNLSLLLRHLKLFRCRKEWMDVLKNLIRTGLWSGGFVEYRSSIQSYSSFSFDRLFEANGFRLIDSLDLFNVDKFYFDANPLNRNGINKILARHLGWNHIGVYEKVSKV